MPLNKTGPKSTFDTRIFLDGVDVRKRVAKFRKDEPIFRQGDAADSVMFIQGGNVKFLVVNEAGKEAVLAMFGPADFFGESCLANKPLRLGTAIATVPTTLLIINKNEMLSALRAEPTLSDRFIGYVLARSIRAEADLIDQLFNGAEKRLARALLLLARYRKQQSPVRVLPKVTQETLAEMIGSTRGRVNFFINKFKRRGFIEINDGIKVNPSLLTVVLHDADSSHPLR